VNDHNTYRRDLIARQRLTDDELATAAARFGIVADGECLPLNALHEPARDIIRYAYDGTTRAATKYADARRLEATDRMHEASAAWSTYVKFSHTTQD
jgi:hypothetical protein